MTFKTFGVLFLISLFFACSADNDVTVPRNLQQYINAVSNGNFGEVVACAASENPSLTYVFFYPVAGATDFRYYEAESLDVDPNDFSKYRRKNLTIQDVFGGKLQRFSRSGEEENWGLVTFMVNGKLHKSKIIRLKNATEATTWTNKVAITYTTSLEPKFSWTDFDKTNNDIFFQVISKTTNNEFVSGTYTKEKTFQFYNTSNVVLNINEGKTPETLKIDTEYKFTLMAVSDDNWVNVLIEENFVPGNLKEYLDRSEVDPSIDITSFGASANGNNTLSHIYFYPLTNARDFRYYETDSINVDHTNLNNYRRKFLSNTTIFGAKLRRFSRTDIEESWSIVTYEIDGKIYTSKPIRLKNKNKPTQYKNEIAITYPQTLKPVFTWTDFGIAENNHYFNAITNKSNAFISGVFTNQKTFQYYTLTNTLSNINLQTPPDLILFDQYTVSVMGLSSDNWVNLFIQNVFEVQ